MLTSQFWKLPDYVIDHHCRIGSLSRDRWLASGGAFRRQGIDLCSVADRIPSTVLIHKVTMGMILRNLKVESNHFE